MSLHGVYKCKVSQLSESHQEIIQKTNNYSYTERDYFISSWSINDGNAVL